jgi:hypothetical protein
MPLFKPIRDFDDLPPVGGSTRTQEAQSIDHKSSYSPDNRGEMAKDMAAFANALGGVILVGTSKDDEPLAYPGISRDFANRLSDGFADAHARHLSPKPPTIERLILQIPHNNNVMFVVNVQPFADQIVAAKIDRDSWRFPVRVGTDTNYLEPAMLPLYATAIRRNAILLGGINPNTDKVQICFRNPTSTSTRDPIYYDAALRDVLITRNVVVITLTEDVSRTHRIPLDDVDGVWDSGTDSNPVWIVRVLGHFSGDNAARRKYHSNPRNARIS